MLSKLRNYLANMLMRDQKPIESRCDDECIDAEMIEHHEAEMLAYDENMLERAKTQWQFGDWESLAKLTREDISPHPQRTKLALLASAGHAQLGNDASARSFATLAREWGCSKKLMSQILIAGVHNSLGRAATVSGQIQKAEHNFRFTALGVVGDEALITKARAFHEITNIQTKIDSIHKSALQTKEKKLREIYFEASGLNLFEPGINSYAQNFEDVMLWRSLKNIQNGFYVDIGAQHPIEDSVSKAFYERGWRGIHVEPISEYAKLLREDRPDETVIEAFLSHSIRVELFYNIPETGLSTGCVEIAACHKSQGFSVEEIKREQTTLDRVFEQAYGREIHWLKIDVEGMEKEVLSGWTTAIRPWIVVVESTLPNSKISNHDLWEKIILDKEYVFVYFDGLNRFYLHQNHLGKKSAFDTPPNVFDQFKIKK